MKLTELEKSQLKSIPDIRSGDVVRVHQKIIEGGKSRIQVFEGVVLSRSGGQANQASITVRKIASGVGVEKSFLLHSPLIEKIEVKKSAKTRRAKLYYLRNLTGRAARLKEKQRKKLEEIGVPIVNLVPEPEILDKAEEPKKETEKPKPEKAKEEVRVPDTAPEPEVVPTEGVPVGADDEVILPEVE